MRIEALPQPARDFERAVPKNGKPRSISEQLAAAGRSVAGFLAELGFLIQALLACWLLRRRRRRKGRQMRIVIFPSKNDLGAAPASGGHKTASDATCAGGDECST